MPPSQEIRSYVLLRDYKPPLSLNRAFLGPRGDALRYSWIFFVQTFWNLSEAENSNLTNQIEAHHEQWKKPLFV